MSPSSFHVVVSPNLLRQFAVLVLPPVTVTSTTIDLDRPVHTVLRQWATALRDIGHRHQGGDPHPVHTEEAHQNGGTKGTTGGRRLDLGPPLDGADPDLIPRAHHPGPHQGEAEATDVATPLQGVRRVDEGVQATAAIAATVSVNVVAAQVEAETDDSEDETIL